MVAAENEGISVLIPLMVDHIPDRTISSVIRQKCAFYEIIILQNDVSDVAKVREIFEQDISEKYENIPIRKF